MQHRDGRLARTAPRRDDPADQMLDQRLRHAGIDVVMAHLVADAVGAPAERELATGRRCRRRSRRAGWRGGTDSRCAARLHVLEGDVVDRLAAARTGGRCRSSICRAAGRMSISAPLTPSAFISRQALPLVCVAGGEAGHGVGRGCSLRGRPSASMACGGDDQRLGRIEPARDADDELA